MREIILEVENLHIKVLVKQDKFRHASHNQFTLKRFIDHAWSSLRSNILFKILYPVDIALEDQNKRFKEYGHK